MEFNNGCKHYDIILEKCKLKPEGMFQAIFGKKCDFHPIYNKKKCHEQIPRPSLNPLRENIIQGVRFIDCEFIGCTFTKTEQEDEQITQAKSIKELYQEACSDYVHILRSCYDNHMEEYFILVKLEGIWMAIEHTTTSDIDIHMNQFLITVERLKHENKI